MLNASAFAEEKLQFVDARDYTGYYVDTNSFSFESPQIVNARVAVVKANTNRIFYYAIRFDLGQNTYQILASEVKTYDTRETQETNKGVQPLHPYGSTSPMHNIVAYIGEWQREKQI